MEPKPKHLGSEYGAQFQDANVVAAYPHRPPYPMAVFDVLEQLIVKDYPRLLDVGCGPGPIARRMVGKIAQIDAVDWSAGMIELGKRLPDGDDPSITWIVGRAEDAPLRSPYGLITAGASLHWMDWPVVIPRLRAALAPGAVIAIVNDGNEPTPWNEALRSICAAASTNRDYQFYDLIEELERRNLFHALGNVQTPALPFVQTVDDYVESFHARNGFSRDRMTIEAANVFDQQVRALVEPHAINGWITLHIFGSVVWGK